MTCVIAAERRESVGQGEAHLLFVMDTVNDGAPLF